MKFKKSARMTAFDYMNYMFLIVLAVLCVYPFYYILIYSISVPGEAASKGVFLLPRGFSIETYKQLMSDSTIMYAAFISVSRTVVGTALSVICCAAFGFVLTQQELKYRRLLYRMVIVTMYLSAGLIPTYLLLKGVGLQNNFLLYIIPGAVPAFNLILVKTYIESIPYSLQESAKMDGANPYVILRKIIMPLCVPVLAVIAIFTAVGQWNSWFDNFILADIPQLRTLQYLLYLYLLDLTATQTSLEAVRMNREVTVTPQSVRMAITTIVTLPVLIVYPVFQKYFVKGIMLGAIKG